MSKKPVEKKSCKKACAPKKQATFVPVEQVVPAVAPKKKWFQFWKKA